MSACRIRVHWKKGRYESEEEAHKKSSATLFTRPERDLSEITVHEIHQIHICCACAHFNFLPKSVPMKSLQDERVGRREK